MLVFPDETTAPEPDESTLESDNKNSASDADSVVNNLIQGTP